MWSRSCVYVKKKMATNNQISWGGIQKASAIIITMDILLMREPLRYDSVASVVSIYLLHCIAVCMSVERLDAFYKIFCFFQFFVLILFMHELSAIFSRKTLCIIFHGRYIVAHFFRTESNRAKKRKRKRKIKQVERYGNDGEMGWN